MFIKLLTALTLFLLVNYMAVADSFSQFLDTASLAIVLGGAFAFAICGQGGWLARSRLSNAAEGAIIAGWLGALYGSVFILGNIGETPINEWIGPACAVMMLTILYGYLVSALLRMIIMAREV
ncbi:MAG: hypothetical protein VW757_10005 [Halieaceae bacterium]|jgi:flagellar motor component MotA|nr:hypothetical protein [Cellvibrionales bacterium]